MTGDLGVLVADKDMQQAVLGLLGRWQSLGIRQLSGVRVEAMPGHDPAVRLRGVEFARNVFGRTHAHVLLLLDLEGSGASESAEFVESQLDEQLRAQWGQRGRSVVIDPELETWVFSRSHHIGPELGFESNAQLRSWLVERGFWRPDANKPSRPKEAMLAALYESRRQVTSARFATLAQSVSLRNCEDRAFTRLVATLQEWFPQAT